MKNLKKTDTKSGKTYFYNFFAYHIFKKKLFLMRQNEVLSMARFTLKKRSLKNSRKYWKELPRRKTVINNRPPVHHP